MNSTAATTTQEPTPNTIETAEPSAGPRPAANVEEAAPQQVEQPTSSQIKEAPPRQVEQPAPRQVEQPAPPKGVLGWLLTLPRYLFRAHLGFLTGHRFLVLVSQGRMTGLRRETPLEVVRYDKARREAVVAAGWGRKTQWLHNVEAGLAREIWIGRERYVPSYRILDVDEAMDALRQYERHSGMPKQIVRRVLSWLLGWTYDGSPAARRRAAEQLPLVAFRPV